MEREESVQKQESEKRFYCVLFVTRGDNVTLDGRKVEGGER